MKRYIVILILLCHAIVYGGASEIDATIPSVGNTLTSELRENFAEIKGLLYGWINASDPDYDDINEAIAACINTTLVIGEAETITGSSITLTVPAGCHIEFTGSGSINDGDNNNLDFAVGSSINAPAFHQILIGFAAGDVTGLRVPIHVAWFGAIPDSQNATVMTNNTTAFINAISTASVANTPTGKVIADAGTWHINVEAFIPAGTGAKVIVEGQGDFDTIITQNTGATNIFNFEHLLESTFRNIVFTNGARAIFIDTNNGDTTKIHIDHCRFIDQTTASIETASGGESNSTILTIENSHFQGTATFLKTYCDFNYLRNNWMTVQGEQFAIDNMNGNLTIEDGHGNTSGRTADEGTWVGAWVRNYGSSVIIKNGNFGADGDSSRGRPLIQNEDSASSDAIRIENTRAVTTDYIFKFNEIPEFFLSQGNTYNEAVSKGIFFNASAADDFMKRGKWIVNDFDLSRFRQNASDSEALAASFEAKKADSDLISVGNSLRYSDQVISYALNSVLTGTPTNVTEGTAAYPFLGGVTLGKITSTAANATYTLTRGTDGFTGILTSPNVYTYVFDMYLSVAPGPVRVLVNFNGLQKYQWLHKGLNIINLVGQPSTVAGGWGLTFDDIPDTTVIQFGRIRVFNGVHNINTVNTEFHDLSTNSPVADANNYYYKGDRVIYANPADGLITGKVITTAGANSAEVWSNASSTAGSFTTGAGATVNGGNLDISQNYSLRSGLAAGTKYNLLNADGSDDINIGNAYWQKLHLINVFGEAITVLADGNVGIGDTTPSVKLDVTGSLHVTGDLTVDGTQLVGTMNVGVLLKGVQAGVTAHTGSSQATGVAITKDIVEISICANAGDALTLPTAVAGYDIFITNHGVASADIFPNVSDVIDEGTVDVAKALAVNASMRCVAYDVTNWECVTLAR